MDGVVGRKMMEGRYGFGGEVSRGRKWRMRQLRLAGLSSILWRHLLGSLKRIAYLLLGCFAHVNDLYILLFMQFSSQSWKAPSSTSSFSYHFLPFLPEQNTLGPNHYLIFLFSNNFSPFHTGK